jgi:hypothetical protein
MPPLFGRLLFCYPSSFISQKNVKMIQLLLILIANTNLRYLTEKTMS